MNELIYIQELEPAFKKVLKYRHGKTKKLSKKDLDIVLHGIEILFEVINVINGGII